MKNKKIIALCLITFFLLSIYKLAILFNFNPSYSAGEKIDSLNHVIVYCNGDLGDESGRNTTEDGYNLGLKYQCVEFVKRYYYEVYNHKMPNSYGNAIDFFNKSLKDGQLNEERNLIQFTNGSFSKPQIGDLVILDGTISNQFGHVAIISKVNDDEIEIIQQNTGESRNEIDLDYNEGKWRIDKSRVLGWLRKKDKQD